MPGFNEMGSVLVIVFLGLSMLSWLVINLSTGLWSRYQTKFTSDTELGLERMFLFFDYRKVFFTNVGLLVLLPWSTYLILDSWFFAGITLALVLTLPKFVLKSLQKRRQLEITNALPETLTQIAGSLRSGATFTAAIETMVTEMKGPVAQEFGLLLKEQKLGISPKEALENLGERVASEEMDLVIAAALIARDVGGNLAETFERLSSTLRRKLEMEGKIRALTSQGKLQGWVVAALPFGIIIALLYIEPAGMQPIFTSYLGWSFLTVVLIMEILGAVMIRKIVSIDV